MSEKNWEQMREEVEAELAACREQNDDYRKHIIPESNRILARVRAEAVREALTSASADGELHVHDGNREQVVRDVLAALLLICPLCYHPKEKASWAFCYQCRVARRNAAIRKTWKPGGRMATKKYLERGLRYV